MSNYEAGLRRIIDAAMEIETQKTALVQEMKDLMTEAKDAGYEPKFLRKVVAREKKGRALIQQEDEMIADYEGRAGLGR